MNLSAVPGFDGAVYLNGFPASKSKKGMVQNQVTNLVLHHPLFCRFFCGIRETLLLGNAKRINGTAEKII